MKYKLKEAFFDEVSGESYAAIQTPFGVFEGFAKLHPAEKHPSSYAGCEYAEYRAIIKAVKAERQITKAQLKTMEEYYNLISNMKDFNAESAPARKARRTIYALKEKIKEYNYNINALETKLKAAMNSRESFLKNLFKKKAKG